MTGEIGVAAVKLLIAARKAIGFGINFPFVIGPILGLPPPQDAQPIITSYKNIFLVNLGILTGRCFKAA